MVKKGHIHRVKIMYIGNWSFFMPPWFIPSSKFLCHPFLCYHNFKMFMLTVLILPQIFLCQRKNRNWESISTFLTHFLHYPHFFMPPSRKLKSFCHLHFMPPWKSLCHSGVGIKNMRVALKKKTYDIGWHLVKIEGVGADSVRKKISILFEQK